MLSRCLSGCCRSTASRKPAALPACLPLLLLTAADAACQVTDAIKQYVEEKVTKAVHNYTQNIKKIDVTLSARGGDTGTHGAK
jgi:hypothetical protein